MGKGTITANLGQGLYTVTLNRDQRRITKRLGVIADRLAALPGLIIGHEAARDAAEVEYNLAVGELNNVITEMKAHPTEITKYQKQATEQTKLILEKEKVWKAWIYAVNAANLEYTSLTLEQGVLQGADLTDPTVAAWCADLTTDLSGIVGTIEVPGERGLVNIKPGYSNREDYIQASDGQLQPTKAGTPASAYYNYAMFAGWQKWKPTYRHGTITAIDYDADTATVLLDTVYSSAKNIPINQATTLSNVPVEYMECNAGAFSVGDKVLVKFTDQDFSKPKVVGFKVNPKPCGGDVYCMQFEKNWLPAWLLNPGPITAEDMFFRVYFKLDDNGYPISVSSELAETQADLADVWSETTWREWINSSTDGESDCQPQHKAAQGRGDIWHGGGLQGATTTCQLMIKLPGGFGFAIFPTGVGVTAWSKAENANELFLNRIYKWDHSPSSSYPWYKGVYMPRIWFTDPAGFPGFPVQE
jgi:hypothetical protein